PTTDWYQSQECFDFCIENEIAFVTMTPVARLLHKCKADGLFPVVGHGDPQVYYQDGTLKHFDFEFQQTWPKIVRKFEIKSCVDFYRSEEQVYTKALELMTRYQWKREEFSFFNNSVSHHKIALYRDLLKDTRPR